MRYRFDRIRLVNFQLKQIWKILEVRIRQLRLSDKILTISGNVEQKEAEVRRKLFGF